MNTELKIENKNRLLIICCAIIILCGAAVRMYLYLGGTGLWLDEGFLFYTLYKHSFAQIVSEPLLLTQSAPLGFMLASKAFAALFGFNEYALRFLPLVCGCLIPLLAFAMLKGRAGYENGLTGPEAGADVAGGSGRASQGAIILALLFTAFEYHLILYSNEFKQYGVEAFVTTAMLCLVSRGKSKSVIFACGLAAMLFSSPAVFVLAGIIAAMFLEDMRGYFPITNFWTRARKAGFFAKGAHSSGDPPGQNSGLTKPIGQKTYLWLTAGWGAFFIAYYFLFLKPNAHPDFYEYWQDWFLRPFDLDWFAAKRAYYKKRSIGPYLDALLIGGSIVLFAGLYRLTRINRLLGTSVIFSLLFTLLASALKLYPLQVRLLLFIFPPLLIVAALGLSGLASTLAAIGPVAALCKRGSIAGQPASNKDAAAAEGAVSGAERPQNSGGGKALAAGMALAVLLACAATAGYVWHFHSIFSNIEKQRGLKPLMPLVLELAVKKNAAVFMDVSWPLFVFYSEAQGKKANFSEMPSEKNVIFRPRLAEIGRELERLNVENMILITFFPYHGQEKLLSMFAEKCQLNSRANTRDTLVYFFGLCNRRHEQ